MYVRFIHVVCLFIVIMLGIMLQLNKSTAIAQSNEGTITRINLAPNGDQGNGHSDKPVISADGRFIAFESFASNLVENDTNGKTDIFVYDGLTKEITLVSVASDGTQANSAAYFAAISGDGRYVAFSSIADNLVSGDTNGYSDLFVHDLQTKETKRISIGFDGSQATGPASSKPGFSYDGRYLVFQSDAPNLTENDFNSSTDVFIYDNVPQTTNRISISSEGIAGNSTSLGPAISADGRLVVFRSFASNLVADDSNNQFDIFLHDRQTGQTTRVSVASDGRQANGNSLAADISAHGRHITFLSDATNLVFDDINGNRDVFIYDRETQETKLVNIVTKDGIQANNDSDEVASVSAIGRSIVFQTKAKNLVQEDIDSTSDIVLRDFDLTNFILMSRPLSLTAPKVASYFPDMSSDGRYIVFSSYSFNLVTNDTNQKNDIFLYDRGFAEPTATPTTSPPTTTPTATFTPSPTATPSPTPTPTATPLPVSGLISPTGGTMLSENRINSSVIMQFPPNAVSIETLVTYSYIAPTLNAPFISLDRFFHLDGIQNGQPIFTTTKLITIVIHYNDVVRRGAIADTIYLYRLSNGQWITNNITFIGRDKNIFTSTTTQFTRYGVFAQTHWHYIPVIMR